MSLLLRSNQACRVWLVLSLLMASIALGSDNDAKTVADKPLIKTTHVYKTVGDVKVEADVYRPEGAEARPVVVWIHGGAAHRRQPLAGAQADSGAVYSRAIRVRVAGLSVGSGSEVAGDRG